MRLSTAPAARWSCSPPTALGQGASANRRRCAAGGDLRSRRLCPTQGPRNVALLSSTDPPAADWEPFLLDLMAEAVIRPSVVLAPLVRAASPSSVRTILSRQLLGLLIPRPALRIASAGNTLQA